MTQSEVEQAVARATGDSRDTVRRYGFSLLPEAEEPSPDPHLAVDCPGCGASLALPHRQTLFAAFVECPRCDALYPFGMHEIYVADETKLPIAA
jgi:hypothetical protein